MSNTHSTTRYTCRFCASPMNATHTPANEPCYECSNRACRFTAMVGAECSMNVAPTPLQPVAVRTPRQRASDKAEYFLSQGLHIVSVRGGWLVPSGTRSNVVHRVSESMQCSCEAGQNGRSCWHVEAIELSQAELVAA